MNCSSYFPAMLRALSLAGVVSILAASAGGAHARENGDRGGKSNGLSKTVSVVNTIHPIIVGRLHREPGDYKHRHPGRSPIRGPLPPQPAPVAGSAL